MPFPSPPTHTTIVEDVRYMPTGSTIENEAVKNTSFFWLNNLISMTKANASTTFRFSNQQIAAVSGVYFGTDEPTSDYDINIKLPVKNTFKIKVKIRTVSKFIPKPFID